MERYNIIDILGSYSYCQDFLVSFKDRFYRLRKLNSPEIFDMAAFSKFETELEPFKIFGLVLPEFLKFDSERPELFYPYHNEKSFTGDISKKNYIRSLYFFFDLIDKVVHGVNFIPKCLDIRDLCCDNNQNFYFIAPFFKNISDHSVYCLSENSEEALISVMNRIIKDTDIRLRGTSRRLDLFFNDIQSRKIDCVSEYYSFYNSFFKDIWQIKPREPYFVDRKKEKELINQIVLENLSYKKLLVYGPQRSGKTSLLSVIKNEMISSDDYSVIEAHSKQDIYSGLLQIISAIENIDYTVLNDISNLNIKIFDLLNILNTHKKFKIAVFIDDYHDYENVFSDLLSLMENIDFQFPLILIVCTNSYELVLKKQYSNFIKIELRPFQIEDTVTVLTSMLSSSFAKKNQDFINFIQNVSNGLPGNIKSLIHDMEESGTLFFKNGDWQVDFDKIELNDYYSFILEKISKIEPVFQRELSLLSVLGNNFQKQDIKELSIILGKDFDIQGLLKTEILQIEAEHYRFFDSLYWQAFYDRLDKTERNKIHVLISKNINEFSKKIWHLKKAKQDALIALNFTQKMKRCIDTWSDIEFIDFGYSELQNMGLANDCATVIYIYTSIISENYIQISDLIDSLKKKRWMRFYYLLAKSFFSPRQTIEEVDSILNNTGNSDFQILYLNYVKLLACSFLENLGDLNELEQIFETVEHIYSKHRNLRKFTEIYLDSCIAFDSIVKAFDRIRSINILESALLLAKQQNLKKFEIAINTALAHNYINESPVLFENMLKEITILSNKSNDFSRLATVYATHSFHSLYSGNVEETLKGIQESQKYSRQSKNLKADATCRYIKALLYFYSGDFNNMNIELARDLAESLKMPDYLQKRYKLHYLIVKVMYAISIDARQSVMSYRKELDEFRMSAHDIIAYTDLYLLDNPQDIKRNFLSLFDSGTYQEETILFLHEKFLLSQELKELYEVKSLKLIEKFRESDQKLSLAITYEGLANFYRHFENKQFDAFKFFRFAIQTYEALNFREKIKNLSAKFYLNLYPKIFGDISVVDPELVENRKHTDMLRFYDDIVSYSLSILSLDNAQEIVEKTGKFIQKRFPVKHLYIKIKSSNFEVESTNMDNRPQIKEVFSINPFEISYISNYKSYTISYILSNENLSANFMMFESIFDSLLIIDMFLSSAINRIIHLENSIVDYLTNAFSRRFTILRIEEELQKSIRDSSDFSLIFFDIDNFKHVNDTYGHKMGDDVLKLVAALAKSSIRSFDILGRYGGEEFIILLPNTGAEEAFIIAQRIRRNFEIKSMEKFKIRITASFGVTSHLLHPDVRSVSSLMDIADSAQYESKRLGKNTVNIK
jgi:diguanylate cyclase (GGDEF)-like protein